jgi:hypothetical protein
MAAPILQYGDLASLGSIRDYFFADDSAFEYLPLLELLIEAD